MSDNEAESGNSSGFGRVMLDVVLYTLARLVMVVGLTAAIFYIARIVGIHDFPVIVALLFGIVLALPLGIWVLGPLRKRATASIATVDERRRNDRARLQARLRGESKSSE